MSFSAKERKSKAIILTALRISAVVENKHSGKIITIGTFKESIS